MLMTSQKCLLRVFTTGPGPRNRRRSHVRLDIYLLRSLVINDRGSLGPQAPCLLCELCVGQAHGLREAGVMFACPSSPQRAQSGCCPDGSDACRAAGREQKQGPLCVENDRLLSWHTSHDRAVTAAVVGREPQRPRRPLHIPPEANVRQRESTRAHTTVHVVRAHTESIER